MTGMPKAWRCDPESVLGTPALARPGRTAEHPANRKGVFSDMRRANKRAMDQGTPVPTAGDQGNPSADSTLAAAVARTLGIGELGVEAAQHGGTAAEGDRMAAAMEIPRAAGCFHGTSEILAARCR
ncbi:MAG: hypothetical protein ACJ8H8_29220 [Geminicoccaceae bacterium]